MIAPYRVIVITADDGSAELISRNFSDNPEIRAEAVSEKALDAANGDLSLDGCHAVVLLSNSVGKNWADKKELFVDGRSVPILKFGESYAAKDGNGSELLHALKSRLSELAERLTLASALQQKDSDLIRIIEKSADSILVFDDVGVVRFINPAARKLFRDLLEVGDEFAYPIVNGETTELDLIAADGKRYVAEMRVTPIEWADSQCCLAMLRDITERKLTEETLENMVAERTSELEAANAQLSQMYRVSERAVQLRTQFIANVSHEIRTPLSGIVSGAELLCESPDLAAAKELGCVIFESGKRLLNLVNEILDFAKIERGDVQLTEVEFSISTLVNELVAQMQPMADQKELRLLTSLSPKLDKKVLGDVGKIRQILLNLVHNALKFTSNGGVIITVQPGDRQEVLFIIRDTGAGIEARDLPLIFQPFVQGSGAAAKGLGGTGLGLSICSQLAKALGGSISCQSEAREGSTFTLRVPLRRA